ncbi:MAG TPA: M48 family metalloprotease [Bryobacteraceae bacterium]|nr:M48 family metalloprotease [Bryobacteraceae bacterium]
MTLARRSETADIVRRKFWLDGGQSTPGGEKGVTGVRVEGGVCLRRSKRHGRIASETVVSGWAVAACSVPVQATVAFRAIANGVPQQEITAQPTLPTPVYTSAANRFVGVALANVYSVPVTVRLTVYDSEGLVIGGPTDVSVASFGHTTFNIWQKFPHLRDRDFDGVLKITGTPDLFVAWSLNGDASGTLSALPPGALAWPISHWDRIWYVFKQVEDGAKQLGAITWPVQLKILYDKEVNAYARRGDEIGVTLGLSELISDSPSELAWALAHELGHTYQQRTGKLDFVPTNREFDADIWGTMLTLAAGYDPYAGSGTLAKLAMATGRAALTTQFEDQIAADAHKSFNTRIDTIYDNLVEACSVPSVQPSCSLYKLIVHPHLPPSAPLVREPRQARE